MNVSASQDEIAAAIAYENLHVPALFRQWAPRVADAAGIGTGQRVLDVACGTGVLARELARRVGDASLVAGVDAGAGMLAVAGQIEPDIDWRQGLAEALPFESGSFDAVVSQFGMMFFTDREKALREMARTTIDGGRVAVAVWESLERSEAYPEEVALLERVAGKRAADALRAPFVLGDTDELETLFRDAGFVDIDVDTRRGTAQFPSIASMVEADLRGWLPVMGVELPEEQIASILSEAEEVLGGFVTNSGTVEFHAPAHIVSATRP